MRTRRGAVGVVAVAVLLQFAGERETEAYVQGRSSTTGAVFSLMPSCLPLPLVVYPGTFADMTTSEIMAAVTGAASAWSAGANPCTYIEFQVTVVSGAAPRAANDGVNMIIFRDTAWCKLDATGTCDPTTPYDQTLPALTTIFARSSTGQIVDADIEVNAYTYSWADRVAHPELTSSYDLQNVLTHEIGHVLGLDSTCFTPGGGLTRPNDNAGQPVPDCATAPASVQATTMFPSTTPGDVEKRTLEPDDRAGVCGIYPAAATPCPAGAGGACACAPPGADAGQDAGGGNDAGASSDAGAGPDSLPADASSTDAGKKSSGGGCGCETAGSSDTSWPACLFLAAAAALTTRARRRRNACAAAAKRVRGGGETRRRSPSSDERHRAGGSDGSSASIRARTKQGQAP